MQGTSQCLLALHAASKFSAQLRVTALLTVLAVCPPPQKLEEQNPDFFRAYYTRLKLKDQVVLFNHLLLQQVNVVQRHAGGWMHSFMPQPSLPGARCRGPRRSSELGLIGLYA